MDYEQMYKDKQTSCSLEVSRNFVASSAGRKFNHYTKILQPCWQDRTQTTARRKMDKFMGVIVKHTAAAADVISALIWGRGAIGCLP